MEFTKDIENMFDYTIHIPGINQMIYDYLNLKEQLKLRYSLKVCSKLYIKNLSGCEGVKLKYLTNDTLKHSHFIKCEQLTITSKSKVRYINHLINLKILKATGKKCCVNNSEITNLLLLQKLSIRDNLLVTIVNHLQNLIELDASHNSQLYDHGIIMLTKLKKLNVSHNYLITNINHMTQLIELRASGLHCRLDTHGICDLRNLELLEADNNANISDVNHLIKLTYLDVRDSSGISDEGMINVRNLKRFTSERNSKITRLNLWK